MLLLKRAESRRGDILAKSVTSWTRVLSKKFRHAATPFANSLQVQIYVAYDTVRHRSRPAGASDIRWADIRCPL